MQRHFRSNRIGFVLLAAGLILIIIVISRFHSRHEQEGITPSTSPDSTARDSGDASATHRSPSSDAPSDRIGTDVSGDGGLDPARANAGGSTGVPPRVGVGAPRLRVVDASENGVADALVIGFRGGEVTFEVTTDQGGDTTIDAGRALLGSSIVVVPRRLPPAIFQDVAAIEDGILRLAAGAGSIAGRLLVDGGIPSEPVSLQLGPMLDCRFLDRRELPDAVNSAIGAAGRSILTLTTLTEFDGSFRFDALPPRFAGSIILPEDLCVTTGGVRNQVRIESFPEDLEIDAMRLSIALGRCTDTDGQPITGTLVSLRWRANDSENWIHAGNSMTGRDGSFAVHFPGSLAVEIRLEAKDRAATTESIVRGPFPPENLVGDLILPRARDVEIAVTDSASRPIEGAIAVIGEGSWGRASDAKGTISLRRVPAVDLEVEVGARGMAATKVQLSADASSPVRVILEASNELVVRVTDDEGLAFAERLVCIEADESPFVGAKSRPPKSVWIANGIRNDGGVAGVRPFRLTLVSSFDGTVRLGCFEPSKGFRVRVREKLTDRVLAESEPLTLDDGERREITLKVARIVPRNVEGTIVQSGTGEPIPFAEARLDGGDGKVGPTQRSDRFGRFKFKEVTMASGVVVASARGFVTARTAPLDLREEKPIEITLTPAEPVYVDVVDSSGRALTAAVSATIAGARIEARRLDRGHVVFESLEPTPRLDLDIVVGGRAFRRTVDAMAHRVLVQLESHGTLDIGWSRELPTDVSHQLVMTDASGYEIKRSLWPGSKRMGPFDALPGAYRLEIIAFRRSEGGTFTPVSVAARENAIIEESKTTSITLDF